jgi:hypothetical protein
VNWWDLDSLGQLWFAAENKIGGKYDDWECTKKFEELQLFSFKKHFKSIRLKA